MLIIERISLSILPIGSSGGNQPILSNLLGDMYIS